MTPEQRDRTLAFLGVVRKFNPAQARVPGGEHGGEWTLTGAIKDALRLAGRIDLEDGEELLGSDKVDGDYGGARFALLRRGDRHVLRVGFGPEGYGQADRDEGIRAWDGNRSRPALSAAERQRLDDEFDRLDDEYDGASPERKAQINRRQADIRELLNDDGEFNGTTEISPADANHLVESIRPALEDAATKDRAYSAVAEKRDRLETQRNKLRYMDRKWTDEEEAEWDRLTAEIDRLEEQLDQLGPPLDGPPLAEGIVPGAWGDVHFSVYYEEPSAAYGPSGGGGPYVLIGVWPKGAPDHWGRTRDWRGNFDAAEARKFLRQLDRLTASGKS